MKGNVLLISGHLWKSPRRAGFHHLATAFHRMGWNVVFVTVAISWVSWLRRDYRLRYCRGQEFNKVVLCEPRLSQYIWWTPWHPVNLKRRLANNVFGQLAGSYGSLPIDDLEPYVKDCDLMVFESTPGLMLFKRFKKLNSRAATVYRVSDSLAALGVSPAVQAAEKEVAALFDLISVPSPLMCNLFTGECRVEVHRHGLEKKTFDRPSPCPYTRQADQKEAVSVGTMLFDKSFFTSAAAACPGVKFHIIGDIAPFTALRNVRFYGEMSFDATIPYVQHADIGIAPYLPRAGAEYLADSSLKMIQYTYCRLPIVAPSFAGVGRPHVCSYTPGDQASIKHAVMKAAQMDRSLLEGNVVDSWEDVARRILTAVGLADVPSASSKPA